MGRGQHFDIFDPLCWSDAGLARLLRAVLATQPSWDEVVDAARRIVASRRQQARSSDEPRQFQTDEVSLQDLITAHQQLPRLTPSQVGGMFVAFQNFEADSLLLEAQQLLDRELAEGPGQDVGERSLPS